MITAMPNLTSSDGTTRNFTVGSVFESNGNAYMYCKSGAAIAQYSACTVSTAGVAVVGTTTTAGARPLDGVVPQFAIAAVDEYFWAPCGPFWLNDNGTPFYVLAALNCVTSVKLYTTGTDGVVDDAATTLLEGLTLTETITTARAATCVAVRRITANT